MKAENCSLAFTSQKAPNDVERSDASLLLPLIRCGSILRIRQNRLAARLESKLSQQQAQQFANLSERLEAIERQQ